MGCPPSPLVVSQPRRSRQRLGHPALRIGSEAVSGQSIACVITTATPFRKASGACHPSREHFFQGWVTPAGVQGRGGYVLMNSEIQSTFDIVDDRLGKSEVLKELGYETRVRETIESQVKCYFHIATGPFRCLSIGCHYMPSGDQLFTFEIFNTNLDESFLIEDWTRALQDPRAPYAFLLSSYKGDFKERLDQLIKYVDWLIQADDGINRILKGEAWTDCSLIV